MKYRNAAAILPDELLKEVQKFVSGETLYIPGDTQRKAWGHDSGARVFYRQRNEEIREKYYQKARIDDLADEYGLSPETIRKIVYR
jgi:hypothetical protein